MRDRTVTDTAAGRVADTVLQVVVEGVVVRLQVDLGRQVGSQIPTRTSDDDIGMWSEVREVPVDVPATPREQRRDVQQVDAIEWCRVEQNIVTAAAVIGRKAHERNVRERAVYLSESDQHDIEAVATGRPTRRPPSR
ncbi:MAG: hypothetical protein JO352_28730 [Chloroflexi bacterium]|nr:hypothetical protein [Chloroflexota bacterium]